MLILLIFHYSLCTNQCAAQRFSVYSELRWGLMSPANTIRRVRFSVRSCRCCVGGWVFNEVELCADECCRSVLGRWSYSCVAVPSLHQWTFTRSLDEPVCTRCAM